MLLMYFVIRFGFPRIRKRQEQMKCSIKLEAQWINTRELKLLIRIRKLYFFRSVDNPEKSCPRGLA